MKVLESLFGEETFKPKDVTERIKTFEDACQERRMMQTGDYATGYAGFASAGSAYAPSSASAFVGSRLCLKSSELASYCGKQFIGIWADFRLIRR